MYEVEYKGMVEELLKKFGAVLKATMNIDYIRQVIRKSYNKGLVDFEEKVQPSINLVPNDDAIDFLTRYSFDLIKDVNEDTVKKLRNTLIAGLMQRESVPQIKTRVHDVLNVSKSRAATIARTETHRAYSMGNLFAAKQSGLTLLKEVYNPSPESEICKSLSQKQAIPIDAKWSYDGKEYAVSPFHPNCRSLILYKQVAA